MKYVKWVMLSVLVIVVSSCSYLTHRGCTWPLDSVRVVQGER